MPPLRIVFMGTPPLAATVLEALLAEPGFAVIAVVTQPDQPRGRELKLQPSAVKEVAMRMNLPVLQPQRARDPQFLDELRLLGPDLMVVAAYGQLLPQALLDLPKFGCLNVHTSLLPKYRGAAPIQWAILNGDEETGVTIMKMDAGLDTGPIVSEERTPIHPQDDASSVHDRLARIGGALIVRTVPDYVRGKTEPRPQPAEGATYARKIKKEDGRMDWSKSARELWNRVRALTPWPGTFTFLQREPAPVLLKLHRVEVATRPDEPASPAASAVTPPMPGRVLSVDRAGLVVACGEGYLRILELQREGGKRMAAAPFVAGFPLQPGDVLMS